MRHIGWLFLALICLALAACGNKGPLVVPDKSAQAHPAQTAAPTQDAARQ